MGRSYTGQIISRVEAAEVVHIANIFSNVPPRHRYPLSLPHPQCTNLPSPHRPRASSRPRPPRNISPLHHPLSVVTSSTPMCSTHSAKARPTSHNILSKSTRRRIQIFQGKGRSRCPICLAIITACIHPNLDYSRLGSVITRDLTWE